jgi:hypothetical protein
MRDGRYLLEPRSCGLLVTFLLQRGLRSGHALGQHRLPSVAGTHLPTRPKFLNDLDQSHDVGVELRQLLRRNCSPTGRAIRAPALARQRRVRGATPTRLPASGRCHVRVACSEECPFPRRTALGAQPPSRGAASALSPPQKVNGAGAPRDQR